MTATERSHVLRERRASGKVVLTVVVGEDELAEIASDRGAGTQIYPGHAPLVGRGPRSRSGSLAVFAAMCRARHRSPGALTCAKLRALCCTGAASRCAELLLRRVTRPRPAPRGFFRCRC